MLPLQNLLFYWPFLQQKYLLSNKMSKIADFTCKITRKKIITSSTLEKAKLNGNYKFNAHVLEFKPRVCGKYFSQFWLL